MGSSGSALIEIRRAGNRERSVPADFKILFLLYKYLFNRFHDGILDEGGEVLSNEVGRGDERLPCLRGKRRLCSAQLTKNLVNLGKKNNLEGALIRFARLGVARRGWLGGEASNC